MRPGLAPARVRFMPLLWQRGPDAAPWFAPVAGFGLVWASLGAMRVLAGCLGDPA